MRFNIKLDGMEIWFAVKGYGPSTSDNWDSQWCDVDYSFEFEDVIHYEKENDEVLLSCEIEEMESVFTKLLENQYTEKFILSFIEPDFDFEIFPKDECTDLLVKWNVSLWHGGLTGNSFSTCMGRNDISAFRDYLRLIIGTLSKNSPEIKSLISKDIIKKYY